MPRRALRKIDPAIDVSRHLKTLDELPRPWDAAAIFSRPAPLEVEVGSGKGLFIRGAAARQPDHNFLGIEIVGKYAQFAAGRLAQVQVTNACMVAADANRVFGEILPAEGVEAVHVYFPDPWWKKRHHKRRIMNPAFLAQVRHVLRPGGTLHFWTDVEEYFTLGLEAVQKTGGFSLPQAVAETLAEHDLDYRTHFERRVRMAGEPVFRTQFTRENGPVPGP